MATEDPQLTKLKQQQDSILKSMAASTTARTGSHDPSPSDIAAQQRLLQTQSQIQSLKDKTLQERWYGDLNENQQAPGGQAGFLGSTLDKLSKPLYAIVGAVDYATGKSGASSLGGAVAENMNVSKRTFSNVLKDSGMPGAVSAPLGFALDIAFDPVNWATVGTAALIPRIVAGGVKGTAKGGLTQGIKAASAGAQSGLLNTAVSARNIAKAVTGPVTGKIFGKEWLSKPAGKVMSAVEKRALSTTDDYVRLTGIDPLNKVAEAGIPLLETTRFRTRIGDLVNEVADKNPVVRKIFEHFNYDNEEWTRIARIKDMLIKSSGSEDEMKAGLKAFIRSHEEGVPFEDALAQARESITQSARLADESAIVSPEINWDAGTTKTGAARAAEKRELDKALAALPGGQRLLQESKDAEAILRNPEPFVTSDHIENARRMVETELETGVTLEDLKKVIGTDMKDTGWKWYDDKVRQMKNIKREVKFGKHSVEVGKAVEKALDGYAGFMSIFKRAKVGASLTAWTNAVVGNPTMALLSGVNIFDPKYANRIKQAASVAIGTRNSDLVVEEMLASSDMFKVLGSNPTMFKQTTGLSPEFLEAKHKIESIFRIARDEGLISADTSIADLSKSVGIALEEAQQAIKSLGGGTPGADTAISSIAASVKKSKAPVPSEQVRQSLISGRGVSTTDLPTGMGIEFYDSSMANKLFEHFRTKSAEGNRLYGLLDFAFNKMSNAYERIDQTYKLGTTMYLTMDGITEAELRRIARAIRVSPEDFSKVATDGQYRFKMSGAKALELANEIYLNYAAMPAAVKVLRQLPLLGAPFASFGYGMALKTAKTLVNNPAAFNRVNFALNDFQEEKSPLEKGVLSDPRYAYLNAPGMFKLPIPGQSGDSAKETLYVNLTNMIPYYSLNMFTPSERSYQDLYSNAIVGTLDKSPIMKDPVFSTIFDYFIQPHIIQDSRPLGSFGQPIYPADASFLEKSKYALYQGIVDPVTPGIWATAAGVPAGYLPQGVIDNLPSYRMRQIANATRGQTAIGKSAKEPASSRTLRSLLGSAGIPVQTPVPLTYLPKDLEETVKRATNNN